MLPAIPGAPHQGHPDQSEMGLPLVEELFPAPEPEEAFLRLASLPGALFLDSARRHATLGRYSFLACDPFEWVELPAGSRRGLAELERSWRKFSSKTVPGLPPFQGGAAGLFSYELGRELEQFPEARFNEFQVPELALGLYDVVLAWDHVQGRCWLISQGSPEVEEAARRRRAALRLEQLRARLTSLNTAPLVSRGANSLSETELAPQFPTDRFARITSNFRRDAYLAAVRAAIDSIHAGDIFQVNLSQRLLHPAVDDPRALYLRLRRVNPATFGGYFDLGTFQIVSASPERFLAVRDGLAEARPIKGTRRRSPWPEANLFAGDELLASEKDRAENVMIVDLLRNDLSRVCEADSVRVTQLCRLEPYEFVLHLVSAVAGRVRPGRTPIDVLRAAFPGGSVTGAPKIRAMEIIAELEPTARGAYCGSLGYIGFDGTMDTNILIRTITAGRGWWQLSVGGGIVAQSDPVREYEETWHKAAGLLQAMSAAA